MDEPGWAVEYDAVQQLELACCAATGETCFLPYDPDAGPQRTLEGLDRRFSYWRRPDLSLSRGGGPALAEAKAPAAAARAATAAARERYHRRDLREELGGAAAEGAAVQRLQCMCRSLRARREATDRARVVYSKMYDAESAYYYWTHGGSGATQWHRPLALRNGDDVPCENDDGVGAAALAADADAAALARDLGQTRPLSPPPQPQAAAQEAVVTYAALAPVTKRRGAARPGSRQAAAAAAMVVTSRGHFEARAAPKSASRYGACFRRGVALRARQRRSRPRTRTPSLSLLRSPTAQTTTTWGP